MSTTPQITKVIKHGGAAVFQRRWMVGKAANRAAVHGSKLPVPNSIPAEEVKMEIDKSIADKEGRKREMESKIDSHLKNWPLLYVEQITCSK